MIKASFRAYKGVQSVALLKKYRYNTPMVQFKTYVVGAALVLWGATAPLPASECLASPGTFPEIETENLAKEQLELPASFQPQGTVVVMGFRREDGDLSTEWGTAIRESLAESGLSPSTGETDGVDEADTTDETDEANATNETDGEHTLNVLIMPVIPDPGGFVRFFITNGMSASLTEEQRRSFVILFTNKDEFQSALNIESDDHVVLVADNSGRILHVECGAPTAEKVQNLIQKSALNSN